MAAVAADDSGPRPAEALEWARAVDDADPKVLTTGPRALALSLFRYADPDGANCRPGDRLLAAKHNVSARTIKRWRTRLVAAGYLIQMARGRSAGRVSGGEGRAAVWQLATPRNEVPPVTLDSEMRGHLRPNEGTPGGRKRGHQRHPSSPETSPGPRQGRTGREIAADVIRDRTGGDDDEIQELLKDLDVPRIRNLAGYVTELASNGSLDRRLAELRARRSRRPSGPPSSKDVCKRCHRPGHDAESCDV
jgi:hypothetical protein